MTLNRLVDSSDRINILNHMVHYRLDATFTALADPPPRGMLAALARGENPISKIAAPYPMRPAGTPNNARVMERRGLIQRRKAGRKTPVPPTTHHPKETQ